MCKENDLLMVFLKTDKALFNTSSKVGLDNWFNCEGENKIEKILSKIPKEDAYYKECVNEYLEIFQEAEDSLVILDGIIDLIDKLDTYIS